MPNGTNIKHKMIKSSVLRNATAWNDCILANFTSCDVESIRVALNPAIKNSRDRHDRRDKRTDVFFFIIISPYFFIVFLTITILYLLSIIIKNVSSNKKSPAKIAGQFF